MVKDDFIKVNLLINETLYNTLGLFYDNNNFIFMLTCKFPFKKINVIYKS